jgi:putative ABC transport system substrate-binding protein
MSYGETVTELFARAAYLVSRVLKGTKPADLPVEQITTPRLVVNLNTARARGLRVPDSILLEADELIR